MKYPILAATLLLATAAPAAAMTIDTDERELYDTSIQCMAYFGVMAGIGGSGPEDPEARGSAAKFLAVASVLADDDDAQIRTDLDAQMNRLHLLTKNPENPDNIRQIREIVENCKLMETLVDAMIESSS